MSSTQICRCLSTLAMSVIYHYYILNSLFSDWNDTTDYMIGSVFNFNAVVLAGDERSTSQRLHCRSVAVRWKPLIIDPLQTVRPLTAAAAATNHGSTAGAALCLPPSGGGGSRRQPSRRRSSDVGRPPTAQRWREAFSSGEARLQGSSASVIFERRMTRADEPLKRLDQSLRCRTALLRCRQQSLDEGVNAQTCRKQIARQKVQALSTGFKNSTDVWQRVQICCVLLVFASRKFTFCMFWCSFGWRRGLYVRL